jgi:hypothetical protein
VSTNLVCVCVCVCVCVLEPSLFHRNIFLSTFFSMPSVNGDLSLGVPWIEIRLFFYMKCPSVSMMT